MTKSTVDCLTGGQSPVQEGRVFLLFKRIYGTLQAAREMADSYQKMEGNNGYMVLNRKKTIFMK
jgi:hypothetical protein